MNTVKQSDDLGELIREAELLQEKIKMEILFKKNKAFFERTTPNVYHKIKDFTPHCLQLCLDENKVVNLFNKKTGRFILR